MPYECGRFQFPNTTRFKDYSKSVCKSSLNRIPSASSDEPGKSFVFLPGLCHHDRVKLPEDDLIMSAPATEEAILLESLRRRRAIHNEFANTLTHGFGLLLSLGGLVVLLYLSITRGGAMHIVSFAIYGTCLVLAYLASTFYHAARCPRRKMRLRMLDHCSIYLLIAGSYTPFLLVGLYGDAWGWSLFGVVWGIALIGIAMKDRKSVV